ncbi:MAG: hypothetical protein C5B48_10250 [Candidatus Rokuibacteriota bacterium]|nr:MAG: hypothetical protein C5B48_10250 [Candidatus Rokubacteria bacterium]
MKRTMIAVLAASALAWCLDIQWATAVEQTGTLGCDLDCVDVWTIQCPQRTGFIEATVSDRPSCDDNFVATLVGVNPPGLKGVGDASHTTPGSLCTNGNPQADASLRLDRPTVAEGPMKAFLSITSFSSTNRDYRINVLCFSGEVGNPVEKTTLVDLTTHTTPAP